MVIKRIAKKKLSLLLAFLMVFTMLPATTLAATTDITGHWAEETLQKWTELGWFNGDGQGSYRPDTGITRAEFMSLVNRMKEYTGQSTDIAKYTDVSSDKWYYNAVSAALAAGYITGTDDTIISPEKPITRQEAMTIIARISGVSSEDASILSAALDGSQVDSWARNTVAACINEGLVAGSDGKINPRSNITRAESVVLMDRVYSNIRTYGFAGTYGPQSGTLNAAAVNVAGSDVRLRNVTVTGDLTIGAAVGNGDVYLEGVTVNGSLNVQGGGMNSIYLDNCNIKELIVTKDAVHIVLDNGSTVTFARVDGENDFIELKGNTKIETLTIVGEDTRITAGANVSITNLNAEADGTKIETQSGTTIGTANITGQTEITGAGKITTANIKSEDVVIETKPTNTNVDSGLTANVGGLNVTGGTPPGGSGGGGGGGGGGTTTVAYESHNADNKTVPYGTPQGDLNLPTTITLTANTGVTGTANVVWNYDTYNSGAAGMHTITGTLSNASVTWAPATITITVTVQEALSVTGGTDVSDVTVKSGTREADAKAKLPQNLVLTLSDNSTVQVSLVWTIQGSYEDTAGASNTFGATIFGLPANLGSAPVITGTVIIAQSDTPVAASVKLTATPQSVQRPTDSSNASVALSALVKDQFGDAFVGATLNYALKESYDGVSYGLEGITPTVTITQDSTDSSVIAVVTVDSTDITGEAVIYITDEGITATSIELTSFVSSMILPVNGQVTTHTFAAVVNDQNGIVMSGESVAFAIKTPVTGVTVAVDGLVTISDQAANGVVFTIVASYGTLDPVEKIVTVVKAASVFSSISQVDGPASITSPISGAAANTAQYTADAFDQYGTAISIAPKRIQWRVEANGTGVSVDGEGLVSVAGGSSATSVDVNAFVVMREGVSGEAAWNDSSTIKSPTKVVAITKATPALTTPVWKVSDDITGTVDLIVSGVDLSYDDQGGNAVKYTMDVKFFSASEQEITYAEGLPRYALRKDNFKDNGDGTYTITDSTMHMLYSFIYGNYGSLANVASIEIAISEQSISATNFSTPISTSPYSKKLSVTKQTGEFAGIASITKTDIQDGTACKVTLEGGVAFPSGRYALNYKTAETSFITGAPEFNSAGTEATFRINYPPIGTVTGYEVYFFGKATVADGAVSAVISSRSYTPSGGSEGYKVTLINNDTESGTLKAYNVVNGLTQDEILSGENAAAANWVAFQVTDIKADRRIKDVEINGMSDREGFLIGAMGHLATTLRQDTTVEVIFEGVPATLPTITGVVLYSDVSYTKQINAGTMIEADATIYAQGICEDETFCIWEYADTADANNWTKINWWEGHYQLQLANADGMDLSGKYIRVRSTGLGKYSTGSATSNVHQVAVGGETVAAVSNVQIDVGSIYTDDDLYLTFDALSPGDQAEISDLYFESRKTGETEWKLLNTMGPNITGMSVTSLLNQNFIDAGTYEMRVRSIPKQGVQKAENSAIASETVTVVVSGNAVKGYSAVKGEDEFTFTGGNIANDMLHSISLIKADYPDHDFFRDTYRSDETGNTLICPFAIEDIAKVRLRAVTVEGGSNSYTLTYTPIDVDGVAAGAGGGGSQEALDTPTGVQVSVDGNHVWVYWNSVEDAQEYRVTAVPVDGDGEQSFSFTGTPAPTYQGNPGLHIELSMLEAGTYQFQVRADAVDGYRASSESDLSTDIVKILVTDTALGVMSAVYDEDAETLTITGESGFSIPCIVGFYGQDDSLISNLQVNNEDLISGGKIVISKSPYAFISMAKNITVVSYEITDAVDSNPVTITYSPKQADKIVITSAD